MQKCGVVPAKIAEPSFADAGARRDCRGSRSTDGLAREGTDACDDPAALLGDEQLRRDTTGSPGREASRRRRGDVLRGRQTGPVAAQAAHFGMESAGRAAVVDGGCDGARRSVTERSEERVTNEGKKVNSLLP